MGTAYLLETLNDMEQRIGPYGFGSEIAAVEVNWGADSYGGMEHHPYFHVGQYDFWNAETQTHELVHGWFGNGVRMACWEDFVLSEGTTTYLTAKVLEAASGYDVWSYYVDEFLVPICEGDDVNTIVMPDGCNEIDFENSDLWSLATYMKGACFWGEVDNVLEDGLLDQQLSTFYQGHQGQPQTMEALIEHVMLSATANQRVQIEVLQDDWLKQRGCPADYASRCRLFRGD